MHWPKGICHADHVEVDVNNIFCYEIKPRETDFRIAIIKYGACDSFFSTSFVEVGKGVLKCYADVSGYGPVNSYVEMPCRTAVNVLLSLMRSMLHGVNRYMLPWNYEISTRTVYADRRGESVKLIYIPVEKADDIQPISSIMKSICDELIPQISESDKEAFAEVRHIFENADMKAEEWLRELYALKAKVNASLDLCG